MSSPVSVAQLREIGSALDLMPLLPDLIALAEDRDELLEDKSLSLEAAIENKTLKAQLTAQAAELEAVQAMLRRGVIPIQCDDRATLVVSALSGKIMNSAFPTQLTLTDEDGVYLEYVPISQMDIATDALRKLRKDSADHQPHLESLQDENAEFRRANAELRRECEGLREAGAAVMSTVCDGELKSTHEDDEWVLVARLDLVTLFAALPDAAEGGK